MLYYFEAKGGEVEGKVGTSPFDKRAHYNLVGELYDIG